MIIYLDYIFYNNRKYCFKCSCNWIYFSPVVFVAKTKHITLNALMLRKQRYLFNTVRCLKEPLCMSMYWNCEDLSGIFMVIGLQPLFLKQTLPASFDWGLSVNLVFLIDFYLTNSKWFRGDDEVYSILIKFVAFILQ